MNKVSKDCNEFLIEFDPCEDFKCVELKIDIEDECDFPDCPCPNIDCNLIIIATLFLIVWILNGNPCCKQKEHRRC